MARAESITFEEFRTRFSTEEICRAELFRFRFPNGFVCPKCGCTEYYPVRGRNTFQCRACRHQTSVTAGTVMHRTHLPLTVWFWAIYLCATDKRGISAVQLSRTLGICYESAWYLLHRIRAAMGKRDEKYELSGIVEMGDGYIGRVTRNGRRLSAASGGQDEGCGVCSDATPPLPFSFYRQRLFLCRAKKKGLKRSHGSIPFNEKGLHLPCKLYSPLKRDSAACTPSSIRHSAASAACSSAVCSAG